MLCSLDILLHKNVLKEKARRREREKHEGTNVGATLVVARFNLPVARMMNVTPPLRA